MKLDGLIEPSVSKLDVGWAVDGNRCRGTGSMIYICISMVVSQMGCACGGFAYV